MNHSTSWIFRQRRNPFALDTVFSWRGVLLDVESWLCCCDFFGESCGERSQAKGC
jgi:hypothetical protein